jgi:hypothetical protein
MAQNLKVLYQGMTLVVPQATYPDFGFSRCRDGKQLKTNRRRG